MYSFMEAYVLSGGKRLRPTALIMTYKGVANEEDRALYRAAICVELYHNFTLIHDDIMDEDDYRRGQPGVQKKVREWYLSKHKEKEYDGRIFNKTSSRFAASQSILAGNILFSLVI